MSPGFADIQRPRRPNLTGRPRWRPIFNIFSLVFHSPSLSLSLYSLSLYSLFLLCTGRFPAVGASFNLVKRIHAIAATWAREIPWYRRPFRLPSKAEIKRTKITPVRAYAPESKVLDLLYAEGKRHTLVVR